jgi:peptidoglycan hydrolase-like protein with peptidoglycan-binding domain
MVGKTSRTDNRDYKYMGKCPTSLLIIAIQLCLISSVRADEQVRQLQDELRKRNLFFGNPNGEFTPALSSALSRYQSRKGFPVTGRLDAETCSSLGITPITPQVAATPFAVVKTGDVRGVNGELLPGSTPLVAREPMPSERSKSRPDFAGTPPTVGEQPPADLQKPTKAARYRGPSRSRRPAARRESNPFALAYQSVDHALKTLFRDPPPKKKRDAKKRG